jgi:2-oxo-3-hexenedioate decarboxylase
MSNKPNTTPSAQGSAWTEDRVADVLYKRELDRTDGGKITDEYPELDLETAYRVQRKLIDLKVAGGERVIGVKLGLTARAKQQQMGIDSPLTAVITDKMVLEAGVPIPMDELIHPKIEPEIVFVMKERLAGPGMTAATAMAAVGSVHAGFEVIDSRFTDFKFTLPDVVADNASSSRLFIGASGTDPAGLDLALEAVVLSVNGTVVATATGAAVQGHPGEALALAANALAERGEFIDAGAVVLTGGMTDAVFVRPGEQITAEFTNLGTLTVTGA